MGGCLRIAPDQAFPTCPTLPSHPTHPSLSLSPTTKTKAPEGHASCPYTKRCIKKRDIKTLVTLQLL